VSSGAAAAAQGSALTPAEQLQIERLFSDPSFFPIEFKKWLKDYLESQDLHVQSGNVIGLRGGRATNLPAGIVVYTAGTTGTFPKPPDTLWADGRAVSRKEYAELFAILGTTYGAGDGSTTFNLPNAAGNGPIIAAGKTVGADQL
jgi:tail collar domain